MSFDSYSTVEELNFLAMAQEMGFHLVDFDDAHTEQDFVDSYMSDYFRPRFLQIARESTNFKQWPDKMNNDIKIEYKGVVTELQATLRHAMNLEQTDPIPVVASYIANNEYSYFCFLRLKKYVQEFYFSYLLDHDEVDLNDCEEI